MSQELSADEKPAEPSTAENNHLNQQNNNSQETISTEIQHDQSPTVFSINDHQTHVEITSEQNEKIEFQVQETSDAVNDPTQLNEVSSLPTEIVSTDAAQVENTSAPVIQPTELSALLTEDAGEKTEPVSVGNVTDAATGMDADPTQYAPLPLPATMPAPKQPKQPGKIAQPLPPWILSGGIVLIVAIMVVLYITGSDWAAGSVHASYAAVAIGILLVIAFIVRSIAGLNSRLNTTRKRQQIFSIVAIVLVFFYAFVAQILQVPLHKEQGALLEHQKQWQSAINEYTLSGEKAPTGVDLARVYTLWGEQLSQQHQYSEASTKFNVVIMQFNSTRTSTLLKRAQNDDISARMTLAQQEMQAQNYSAAATGYAAIMVLSYCSPGCTTVSTQLAAKAYYDLGMSDLQAKDYNDAINAFDVLLTRFPANTPEIKESHNYEAQALLGYGEQVRISDCSNAVPIFERLVNEFGDTTYGKVAKILYDAPQIVMGTFTNTESDRNYNEMGLTQGLSSSVSQDQIPNYWANARMVTSIDSQGNFIFVGVPQGTYELMWASSDYVEFINSSDPSSPPRYVAHVGPLCPVNMGNVTNMTTQTQSL